MTHKEKLIELYTFAVRRYKEAEKGIIWEYSGNIEEDLADLEIEVQNMITKFTETLQELDTVNVVRCKNCVNWTHNVLISKYYGECCVGNVARHEDDFCSYGKRKEE